jgi:hypothetical protein
LLSSGGTHAIRKEEEYGDQRTDLTHASYFFVRLAKVMKVMEVMKVVFCNLAVTKGPRVTCKFNGEGCLEVPSETSETGFACDSIALYPYPYPVPRTQGTGTGVGIPVPGTAYGYAYGVPVPGTWYRVPVTSTRYYLFYYHFCKLHELYHRVHAQFPWLG